MRKKFTLLIMLAMLFGSGLLHAATITLSGADFSFAGGTSAAGTGTFLDEKLTITDGEGGSNQYQSNQTLKLRPSSPLTFTGTGITLNSIVFNNSKASGDKLSANDGSIAYNSTAFTYTWTAANNTTSSVAFTVSGNINDISSIVINYTEDNASGTFKGQYTVTAQHNYQNIASGHSGYETWTSEPSQGTYTFTGAGTISGGTEITEVPGITMTVGAEGDNNWSVVSANALDGSYNLGAAALYCPTAPDRPACTRDCFFDFNPIVSGYLTIRYYTTSYVYVYQNGKTEIASNKNTRIQTLTVLVKAGERYSIAPRNSGFYLNSFSFRPAFLAPSDYATEQTGEFSAGVGTTAYPKVLTEANENVSHWANRNVAVINTTGDVTVTGNGWTIVGANAYQPGNSDRHLTAIYTMQTSALEVTSTSPADRSVPALNDVQVIDFVFDRAITLSDNYKITLTVDGETTEYTSDHVALEGNNTVRLSVDSRFIAAGNTFTVTLAAGSVYDSGNASLMNAAKTISFTLSSDEPVVAMTYPTDIYAANIGTAIALTLNYNNESEVKDIKDQMVVGTLSAAGEEPMEIHAYKVNNSYIFKPTRTLSPNTQYTIFVEANQMTMRTGAQVTHDKSFSFTTGNAGGSAPSVASSWPAEGQIVAASNYASGTYTVTFDQNIKIEPYTVVSVTPRNGSENTSSGRLLIGDNNPTLSLKDDKTIQFNYGTDNMKWDLVQEILIPANSVTASGGMPNTEPIVITFRMSKNPAARTLTQADLPYMDGKHPYTWDFNNFGQLTGTYSDVNNKIQTAGGTSSTAAKGFYTLWTKPYMNGDKLKFPEDYIALYLHRDTPNKFEQGSEIYYMTESTGAQKFYMDEYRGLRINIKNLTQNDRLRIKNTQEYGESMLYFVGNTHYITIPSIPSNARVYILGTSHRALKDNPDPEASGGRFTINSKNAKFVQNWDENNGQEYAEINEKIQKTYIVDMDAEGCAKWGNDLTFCISDFSIDKIAISVDDKQLTQFDGIAYATDCQTYPVEYKLTNAFGMGDITGMYILDHDPKNSGVNSSSASIFSTDITYAAGVDRSESGETVHQGTIVKATTANTSTLEKYNGKYLFPYFTTDVNTQADELYTELNMTGNMLVGVLDDPYTVLTRETEDNEVCYVFTATRYTTDADGNLLYMQPKDDKNWNKQAPVQEGDKWYITENDGTKVEVTYDATKKVYYLLDESGNKMPKVKVGNLPSFQPVMRKGQTAAGKPIDTGNLEENVWQLGPHKSYLKLTKASNVNEVIFFNGEGDEELLDGINTVNNGVVMESGAWYTLQGVKLNGTPKQQGIYIFNNKKVLIK